jgi:hypothetical protein
MTAHSVSWSFALALAATLANYSAGYAQMLIRQLNMQTKEPIKVQITINVPDDGCNKFGLSGQFRRIQPLPYSLRQDFIADFHVTSTLTHCVFPQQRGADIALQSEPFEIRPNRGVIIGRIYAPQIFQLKILSGSGTVP